MSTAAYKRLNKEYKQIQANPPPYIIARPSESNLLDWHYVITGPPGTPYEGGQYHGRITFPSDYPFKPPRIKMSTPSGRFEINQRLCLSMSDFHEESWNPSWSVSTIVTGLLSFMTGDERTTGSIVTSNQTKINLAGKSKEYNTYSNPAFKEVFPDIWEQNVEDLKQKVNKPSSLTSSVGNVKTDTKELTKGTTPSDANVVEDINKIEDAEDRIRAQLIKSGSDKKTQKDQSIIDNNNKSNTTYFVILAVVIGIVLKVIM